jgi:hypothetical protein
MGSAVEQFREARWGILSHWLADRFGAAGSLIIGDQQELTPDQWNRRVDEFRVDALAAQLASVGAGYYFLTLGQNSGFYCSPNATYDRIVDREVSRLSRRDLVVELSDALAKHGIKLGIYLPSGAPDRDPLAVEKLQWRLQNGLPPAEHQRLPEFQGHWEAVIREWSERWGDKVFAWWIDGCYFVDAMYRHDEAPNFASFKAALQSGNPDALVAFNSGVEPNLPEIIALPGSGEDYTSGEISYSLPVPDFSTPAHPLNLGATITNAQGETAQRHLLTFLAGTWGSGEPRFSPGFVREYTALTNQAGGVITWDVPLNDDGTIADIYLEHLPR